MHLGHETREFSVEPLFGCLGRLALFLAKVLDAAGFHMGQKVSTESVDDALERFAGVVL